jgi:hypothetical protein
MKFYGTVASVFILSFVAVVWAVRGGPTIGSSMVTLPAQAAVETARASQQSGQGTRQTLEAQTRVSAYDTDLNRLRHTTMQAAYAYMVAPCDPRNKSRFVEATTDYAKAFISRTSCSLLSCSRDKIAAAGAAFNTDEDRRVQRAIEEAFSRGGISASDFPVGRQMAMLGFIGSDSPNNYCSGGVQTRVGDKRR